MRRAVKKAYGDRDRALHNVARLLGTKVEALSPHILAVVDAMLRRDSADGDADARPPVTGTMCDCELRRKV